MNRMWISGVALVAALAVPALSWAHTGHAHKVMGTVSAVTASQLEVKGTDGKIVVIALDGKTIYQQGKTKADVKMLRVGQRVVVEAEQAAGAKVMTAKTVQTAAAAPVAAAVPAADSHAH